MRSVAARASPSRIATTSSRTQRDRARRHRRRRLPWRACAPRRGCAASWRGRRRRAASPLRARPTSSSSILRPRRPVNTPENAARVRPRRSRSRGRSTTSGSTGSCFELVGRRDRREIRDLELRRPARLRALRSSASIDGSVAVGGDRRRGRLARRDRRLAVATVRERQRRRPPQHEHQNHDDDDEDHDDHAAEATQRARASVAPARSSSSCRSRMRWLTTRLEPPGGIDTP